MGPLWSSINIGNKTRYNWGQKLSRKARQLLQGHAVAAGHMQYSRSAVNFSITYLPLTPSVWLQLLYLYEKRSQPRAKRNYGGYTPRSTVERLKYIHIQVHVVSHRAIRFAKINNLWQLSEQISEIERSALTQRGYTIFYILKSAKKVSLWIP